jgi:hypothetical protein
MPAAASHSVTAATGQAIEPRQTATTAPAPSWSVFDRHGDAETFRAFLEVGKVERDQLGSAGGQGEADQQQGAIALAGQVGLAAGDHRQKLVRGGRRFLDWRHAERSPRAAHHRLDPFVVGRRRQPGEAVAISDPGDSAPEGGAFDASTGFGRDERRHDGRVGGQRAQALIGAPCPEDGEVAAVGALGRRGLLCTREVGGAVERVAQCRGEAAFRDRQGWHLHVHFGARDS